MKEKLKLTTVAELPEKKLKLVFFQGNYGLDNAYIICFKEFESDQTERSIRKWIRNNSVFEAHWHKDRIVLDVFSDVCILTLPIPKEEAETTATEIIFDRLPNWVDHPRAKFIFGYLVKYFTEYLLKAKEEYAEEFK